MYNLERKVVFITGAAKEGNIGHACALRLAKESADIAVIDICKVMEECPEWEPPIPEDLQKVCEQIEALGRKALPIIADVRNKQQVLNAVDKVIKELGGIDILVNSAGVGACNFLDDVDEVSDWDRTIDVNLKGTFLCCQAVAPHMREKGSGKIVNIASISGLEGESILFPYAAAKAGVLSLTQGLAKVLGPHGINVNAVNPGLVWTPMWKVTDKWIAENIDPFKDQPYMPKQAYDTNVQARTALKRPTTPEHIASVVAFLVSEESSEVTGQHINVDGGIAFK